MEAPLDTHTSLCADCAGVSCEATHGGWVKAKPAGVTAQADVDGGEGCSEEEEAEGEEEAGEGSQEAASGRGDEQAAGVPPGMKQAPPQRRKSRRANRVSVCTAKCRSSLLVTERAALRLQWELVSRDTPEVSVYWLEHTDSTSMVSPFQVMSKIEGMLQVCRKADLAACVQAMQECYPDDYDFIPRTWIISKQLPEQVADLEKTMSEKKGWTYICKPTAGSQGRGLRMVRTFAELRGPVRDAFPKGSERLRPAEYVVQRYISKPLLVDGYKFDCRCYVIVTGVVPLRAYLFEEGLARFCTTKYERPRARNLRNACMHFTNYAVNKHSDAFGKSRAHDAGSKRSLSSVFALVEAEGGPSPAALWGEIRGLAEKTILAVRPALVEHIAQGDRGAFHPAGPKGFHILGFDVMFDEEFCPMLLELNANSSMSVQQPGVVMAEGGPLREVSELDLAVKAELICQALLCVNPLSHGVALRRRIAWLEAYSWSTRCHGSVYPPTDEPIPLDDDGDLVFPSAAPGPPRIDLPSSRCPALCPLEFDSQPAMAYARTHLEVYRVWRHFSFNPPGSCPLRSSPGSRRYLGFGRAQFRQLCDAAGMVGGSSSGACGSSTSCSSAGGGAGGPAALGPPCWPERSCADLFFARVMRGIGAEDSSQGCGGSGGGTAGSAAALDFTRFLRRFAQPVGELLTGADQRAGSCNQAMALEAFIFRALPAAARGASCSGAAAACASSAADE